MCCAGLGKRRKCSRGESFLQARLFPDRRHMALTSRSQSRRAASKHLSTSKHAAACITFHPLDCSLLHSHTNRRVICLFHTVPHVQSAPRMRYLQNIGHGMGGPCRARRYDEERHLRLSAPSLHVVVLVNIPVVASTVCLSHFVNLLSINQSLFLIASSTLAF